MASIIDRSKTGAGPFIVKWREGGRDSKQRYKSFKTRAEAETFKASVEPAPGDKLIADAKRRGEYVDPFGELDRFGKPIGTPEAPTRGGRWRATSDAWSRPTER